MKIASTVAGLCVIRDARDIAPLLCGHYLRIGFGHIAFIDDSSSDGTFELLTEFARREPRVSVRRVVSDGFSQAFNTSTRANELIASGFNIIIPFDSDEFWDVDPAALELKYSDVSDVAFYGVWTNFVQNRRETYPRPFGLLGIRYSAPARDDAGRRKITVFELPLVCKRTRKSGIKTRRAVRFGSGQHHVIVKDKQVDEATFPILHLPLRYKSELTKRALNYEPRRALTRVAPTEGWQGPFHREVVLANRTDEVWAANSASNNGYLDCYGKRIRLVPDRRLQKVLLLSTLYLLMRGVRRAPKAAVEKLSKTPRACRRLAKRALRSAGLMKPKHARTRPSSRIVG